MGPAARRACRGPQPGQRVVQYAREPKDRGRGDLENTLTSVHPYLRYAVNDRLAVWGLFGYGWGELDLEMDNGMTIETDTNLVMGAFGGRGILLSAAESGGFQLATRTDAMLTRTTSDKVAEMESAEADGAPAAAGPGRLAGVHVGRRPAPDAHNGGGPAA